MALSRRVLIIIGAVAVIFFALTVGLGAWAGRAAAAAANSTSNIKPAVVNLVQKDADVRTEMGNFITSDPTVAAWAKAQAPAAKSDADIIALVKANSTDDAEVKNLLTGEGFLKQADVDRSIDDKLAALAPTLAITDVNRAIDNKLATLAPTLAISDVERVVDNKLRTLPAAGVSDADARNIAEDVVDDRLRAITLTGTLDQNVVRGWFDTWLAGNQVAGGGPDQTTVRSWFDNWISGLGTTGASVDQAMVKGWFDSWFNALPRPGAPAAAGAGATAVVTDDLQVQISHNLGAGQVGIGIDALRGVQGWTPYGKGDGRLLSLPEYDCGAESKSKWNDSKTFNHAREYDLLNGYPSIKIVDIGHYGPDTDVIVGLDFPGMLPTGNQVVFWGVDATETRVTMQIRTDIRYIQFKNVLGGDEFHLFRMDEHGGDVEYARQAFCHARNSARDFQKVVITYDLGAMIAHPQYGPAERAFLSAIVHCMEPARPDLGIESCRFVRPAAPWVTTP